MATVQRKPKRTSSHPNQSCHFLALKHQKGSFLWPRLILRNDPQAQVQKLEARPQYTSCHREARARTTQRGARTYYTEGRAHILHREACTHTTQRAWDRGWAVCSRCWACTRGQSLACACSSSGMMAASAASASSRSSWIIAISCDVSALRSCARTHHSSHTSVTAHTHLSQHTHLSKHTHLS